MRERTHEFNSYDLSSSTASLKPGDTRSVSSGTGHPYMTPPEIVDIDEVDLEISGTNSLSCHRVPLERRQTTPTKFVPNRESLH